MTALELPASWAQQPIGEVFDLNPPRPSADALAADALVTFVPMPAVDVDAGAVVNPDVATYSSLREKSYTAFAEKDVIFAKITPCMENGKCAVAECLVNGIGFGSTEFHVLRSRGNVDPAFLRHFLRRASVRRDAEAHMTGSVGQRRVPKSYLESLVIPVPPPADQVQIVARLDAIESTSRSLRDQFDRVQGKVDQLRMAVRAAACTGRLSEDWRADHPAALPEELQVQSPEDFELGDTMAELPELPDSWGWIRLEDVLLDKKHLSYGILKPGAIVPSGVPMVRIVDVGDGSIDSSNLMYVSPVLANEYERTKLGQGDVVLAIMATIGRAAVVPRELEGANVNRALAVLKLGPLVRPEYVSLVLRSPLLRAIFSASKLGSAQARINLGALRAFPFPLPPFEEQDAVLNEVQRFTALTTALAGRIGKSAIKAERILEAAYDAAFAGSLVQR